MKSSKKYDVIVIGGGPAGMMAAGRAAECGARIVLFEKNDSLGRKLLLTGGGRCNLTNATFDRNLFLSKFPGVAKFLHSPLSTFGVQETLDFFHALDVPTKTEEERRVFPVSDQAKTVLDALERYMKRGSVTVVTSAPIDRFETTTDTIVGIRLADGSIVTADSYILTTGGTSHPETGSTGDGFRFLRDLGHTINEPRASLVPIRIREPWTHTLSGTSFSDAGLTVFQDGKKKATSTGKLLFTHFGLSGPLALNMSRTIDSLLQNGEVLLSVDLFPYSDIGELDGKIRGHFDSRKNKQIQNSLDGFIPPLVLLVALRRADIDPEKPIHSVTKDERLRLSTVLKGLMMTVDGLLGPEKAIVTSGGVPPEEVDFKRMRSRIYPNLFLAGDILDIDRPSGGYSLQLCWTTGYVAGTAATDIVSRT
ncbi:MAG: NAD(P)/FAD-dependent oxidoreductase [Candidatus Moraniibacteriota bacterium]